jgi:ABC-2 type transport system permease protein
LVEGEIGALVGHPVSINLQGNRVYTKVDSAGYPLLTTFALIYVTTIVGLTMVPHLMIEEKQSKTMDALLISPASSRQIILGKALTGVLYTLISVGVVLAFHHTLVTNWPLALLVAICGSVLGVALGLLLGSLLEGRQQLMLWGWVLIVPLLMPVFLSPLAGLLPEGVRPVIEWVPTVALGRAFRASFSDTAPVAQFGPELALVAGCGMLVLVVVAWVVRRSDR